MILIASGHHVVVSPKLSNGFDWATDDPNLFYSAPVGHPDNLKQGFVYNIARICKFKPVVLCRKDLGLGGLVDQCLDEFQKPRNDKIFFLFAVPPLDLEIWQAEDKTFEEIHSLKSQVSEDFALEFNMWKSQGESNITAQENLKKLQALNDKIKEMRMQSLWFSVYDKTMHQLKDFDFVLPESLESWISQHQPHAFLPDGHVELSSLSQVKWSQHLMSHIIQMI